MSRRTLNAMALALVVPGAGHLYLGRWRRAAAFFVIVVVMFVAGLGLHGHLNTPDRARPLTLLSALGSMGVGLPYVVALAFGPWEDDRSPTFEYGTAFILTAGLMNLLLVLDSFDIAEERKK